MSKLTPEYRYDADDDLPGRVCDDCEKPFRKGQHVYVGSYDPDTGSSHYCRACASHNIKDESNE